MARDSAKDWSPTQPLRPQFVDGYLEAALWSGLDHDSGRPLDEEHTVEDFSEAAVRKAVRESNAFIKENQEDLDATGASDRRLGLEFWLTRNQHGTGYWDRGYGEAGERLTKAAHAAGSSDAYVGDDDRLHLS